MNTLSPSETRLSDFSGSVLSPLTEDMAVDLVVNEEGQVWILHDKPLSGLLKWVEYDAGSAVLNLVFQDGVMQDIGLKVNEKTDECLKKGRNVFVGYMKDGQMLYDFGIVPLTINDTAWN